MRLGMKPTLVDRTWLWITTIPLATAVTVLGLFFFRAQALLYDSFYGSLSVNLEDVGLNYTTILARSGDQIVFPLAVVLLCFYVLRRAQMAAPDLLARLF
jgi:hypothetical protein